MIDVRFPSSTVFSSATSGYRGTSSKYSENSCCYPSGCSVLGRRSAIFSSQNVRTFSPFSPARPKKTELTQPRPQDISVAMHFLLIACIIDVIWSDIANLFQTLAGYEEVAREFEPIKHGEMFWMNYRHYTSYLKKSISFGLPRFCVLDKSKAFNCSIPVLHVKKKICVIFFRLGQYRLKQCLLWIRNLTSGQGSIRKGFQGRT